jgi:hypothetical protein
MMPSNTIGKSEGFFGSNLKLKKNIGEERSSAAKSFSKRKPRIRNSEHSSVMDKKSNQTPH